MNTTNFHFAIIVLSILFWVRYFYLKSFKNKSLKTNTLNKIIQLITYLPIGLQAVYLFIFAIATIIPLSKKLHLQLTNLLGNNVLNDLDFFLGIKIIINGVFIITINYYLIKYTQAVKNQSKRNILKIGTFIIGLFFFYYLITNLLRYLIGEYDTLISYCNNVLLGISIIVTVLLLIKSKMNKEITKIFKAYFVSLYSLLSYIIFFFLLSIFLVIWKILFTTSFF